MQVAATMRCFPRGRMVSLGFVLLVWAILQVLCPSSSVDLAKVCQGIMSTFVNCQSFVRNILAYMISFGPIHDYMRLTFPAVTPQSTPLQVLPQFVEVLGKKIDKINTELDRLKHSKHLMCSTCTYCNPNLPTG